MNKRDLITEVSKQTGLTKQDTKIFINITLETILKAANDDKVSLSGFGTFKTKVWKPRVVLNPITKEKIYVPEKKVLTFKQVASASKYLTLK